MAIYEDSSIVDAGFENGTDGVAFPANVIWHSMNSPLVGEYDIGAKMGSLCGRIKGADGVNAGYWESTTGGMTANGAEIRFWHKPVNNTTLFYLTDYANPGVATPSADRVFQLYWFTNGTLYSQTTKTSVPTGYITGDNIIDTATPSGWTQYKMVFYFTGTYAQRFTLSRRANVGDSWVTLKTSGALDEYIPMYGSNTITQNHGTLWRGNTPGGAEFWIDDLRYSNTGIVESTGTTPTVTTHPNPQTANLGDSVSFSVVFSGFPTPTYQWQKSTTAGGGIFANINGQTTTTLTFTAQSADDGYLYRCVATNILGSATTNSASLSVNPATPTGLTATGGSGQVSLSWVANTEPDLAGYDLYRGGTKINATPIVGTTYTDTGRSDYTIYSYQLSARDTNNNVSPLSTVVTAITASCSPATGPTLIDNGFESGVDGTTLSSPPWTASGVPQRIEYDNVHVKFGSISAWIQGAVGGTNAGAYETTSGGMSANGAEFRLWVYLNDASSRLIEDYSAGLATADRAYHFQLIAGQINILTDRAGVTGYTSGVYTDVGTVTTGWTQLRIVYYFSGANTQTYTLSKRAADGDGWTPLKSAGATDYYIPMRGTNTITQSHGNLIRALGNAQVWVDNLTYSNIGISDDIVPPSVPVGLTAVGGSGEVVLSWTANSEPDIAGYDLYRDGVKINVATIVTNTYTDTSLASAVTYMYQIRARDTSSNVSALSSEVVGTVNGAVLFTFSPPEAVYEDRFTLRWSKYTGTNFAAYDIYRRTPVPFPETWTPTGSTDLITSITDINTLTYIMSSLGAHTEYDVCIVVRRTDGSHVYAARTIDSALMTQVTGNITFVGGARHVNTTSTNEIAMAMDCDLYNKPYLFSVFNNQIRSGVWANTDITHLRQEVVYDPSSGRFSRPRNMTYGYGAAVQSNSGFWGVVGHFNRNPDGSPWDGVSDRHLETAISRSTDGVNWSDLVYVNDVGLGLGSTYKLIASQGRPITLSDGSGVLPLYISREIPQPNRRVSCILARTPDNGQTFSNWGYIYNNPDDGSGPFDYIDFCGEPCVVKIGGTFPNEHLVSTFRPNNSGHVFITQSIDSGRTFDTEILADTIGAEVTPHDFGSASPQMHYDGAHIYLVVGNRVYDPTYPYLRPETSGAYLFRMPYTYSQTNGIPNRIPNLNANWSPGLRLGGQYATSNFDICYYGDVISIDSNTLLCSYYECVGSPRSYEGFQPTIDDPGQTKPQTSMPYIGMRYVDKTTMSITTFSKTVQSSYGLAASVVGLNVFLGWEGSANIYRSATPGVTGSSELIASSDATGTKNDRPGIGTWYYRALIDSEWTNEVSANVVPQLNNSLLFGQNF